MVEVRKTFFLTFSLVSEFPFWKFTLRMSFVCNFSQPIQKEWRLKYKTGLTSQCYSPLFKSRACQYIGAFSRLHLCKYNFVSELSLRRVYYQFYPTDSKSLVGGWLARLDHSDNRKFRMTHLSLNGKWDRRATIRLGVSLPGTVKYVLRGVWCATRIGDHGSVSISFVNTEPKKEKVRSSSFWYNWS